MPRSWFAGIALVLMIVSIALGSSCAHRGSVRKENAAAYLTIEKSLRVPADVDAKHIIQTAKTYLGTRYRFGGNGTKGTDCSGFTQVVYRKHGIRLPRSTVDQAQMGHFVSTANDLEPGDLVFFETYREGPSHVGIYLGGKRFIHASTGKKKVVITSMKSDYYVKRFLGGKRLL